MIVFFFSMLFTWFDLPLATVPARISSLALHSSSGNTLLRSENREKVVSNILNYSQNIYFVPIRGLSSFLFL